MGPLGTYVNDIWIMIQTVVCIELNPTCEFRRVNNATLKVTMVYTIDLKNSVAFCTAIPRDESKHV